MIRSLCRVPRTRLPLFSSSRLSSTTLRSFHFSRFASAEAAESTSDNKTESKQETKEEKTSEQALLEKKDAEIQEWKNKYLTSLADMQNLRTRTQNDVTAAKKYAGTEFAKSMLEVADNLGYAIKAATPDANDSNPKLKALYEGIVMTQQSLIKAFAANSVTHYKSDGEKFDPNLHMGLYQFEDPNKEPGTVGNVVKEGYKIADRVLRAAQVGTVKAPSKPAEAKTSESTQDKTMEEQQKENVKKDLDTANKNIAESHTKANECQKAGAKVNLSKSSVPEYSQPTEAAPPNEQKESQQSSREPRQENVTQLDPEKSTNVHPEQQTSA